MSEPESAPNRTDDNPFTFKGSMMDGPDIDIIELAGLELTDDETDQISDETDPRDLLNECPCLTEIPEGDFDGLPGQSDEYFRYEATSKEQLANELRKVIQTILKSS